MRTLPAFDLDIPAQAAWTWLVDALALLALLTIVGWFAVGPAPSGAWRTAWLLIGVMVILLALHARRSARCRLRWDGRLWYCAPASRVDDLPLVAGRLSVMIDVQSAMLLHFQADGPHRSSKARWIAVRRRGLDAAWHELRCAVFNSRSEGGAAAPDRSIESRQ